MKCEREKYHYSMMVEIINRSYHIIVDCFEIPGQLLSIRLYQLKLLVLSDLLEYMYVDVLVHTQWHTPVHNVQYDKINVVMT